jgi:hypothetical protein
MEIKIDQSFSAALKAKRRYVGYEIEQSYVELANRRIKGFQIFLSQPHLFEESSEYEAMCNFLAGPESE